MIIPEELNARGNINREKMPEAVRAVWQDAEQGDRRQEIVLIGHKLDEAAIHTLLESALLPPT